MESRHEWRRDEVAKKKKMAKRKKVGKVENKLMGLVRSD